MRPIRIKSDLYETKETYMIQKKPRKETCINPQRLAKETCINQKGLFVFQFSKYSDKISSFMGGPQKRMV